MIKVAHNDKTTTIDMPSEDFHGFAVRNRGEAVELTITRRAWDRLKEVKA
jgi:hypothetical protein